MAAEPSAEQWTELAARAAAVRERAHAPYSGYKVGAALLVADGRIFEGVNVENGSYGLTVCAERAAACAAVTAGVERFTALAIATKDAARPCGACRQFLIEFGAALPVMAVGPAGAPGDVKTLAELMPDAFRLRRN